MLRGHFFLGKRRGRVHRVYHTCGNPRACRATTEASIRDPLVVGVPNQTAVCDLSRPMDVPPKDRECHDLGLSCGLPEYVQAAHGQCDPVAWFFVTDARSTIPRLCT